MTDVAAKGPMMLVPPGGGRSYWQPVPANGFVHCLLAAAEIGAETPFSLGTQTVAAGCHVREHVHPDHEEVIFVLQGTGHALLEGERREISPGACLFLGRGRVHAFHAAPDAALTFLWLLMPGGLETFFARIGLERRPGEPAPEPFPRPADVLRIEAETVFGTVPRRD